MEVVEIIKKYYSKDIETFIARATYLRDEVNRLRNSIYNPQLSYDKLIGIVEDVNNFFREFNTKYSDMMKKIGMENFKTFHIENFNIYYLMRLFNDILNELNRFIESMRKLLE